MCVIVCVPFSILLSPYYKLAITFAVQNEGSFGCEVVGCVIGQPNVPECAWVIFR
jgi:hypothetical protein